MPGIIFLLLHYKSLAILCILAPSPFANKLPKTEQRLFFRGEKLIINLKPVYMLEIVALIYLTKNIGNLAIQKGIKPGPWKIYTVLCWIGAEILGVIIGLLIFGEEEKFPAFIFGYACAIASYFILKSVLNKKPEVIDEISQIGQDLVQ